MNEYFLWYYLTQQPSVLSHCWLGGRKGIWSVKKLEWRGTGVVVCLEQGTDLHMAQLMPLPLTISCFSKIQIGFTFLVPAHLGSPDKGLLNGCVCVCVYYLTQIMDKRPLTYIKRVVFVAIVVVLNDSWCPPLL